MARALTAWQAASAFAHPTRARIMFAFADSDRPRSPNELAVELGVVLGQVSHHVRALRDLGAIQLVRTEQRRGALEHFYVMGDDATVRSLVELLPR